MLTKHTALHDTKEFGNKNMSTELKWTLKNRTIHRTVRCASETGGRTERQRQKGGKRV